MKVTVPHACLALALALATAHAAAQGTRIWRCGNTYTNDAAQAQAQGCKVVEGGNITVVEGTRVQVVWPPLYPRPPPRPSRRPARGWIRPSSGPATPTPA
jgi:hypothetical protein